MVLARHALVTGVMRGKLLLTIIGRKELLSVYPNILTQRTRGVEKGLFLGRKRREELLSRIYQRRKLCFQVIKNDRSCCSLVPIYPCGGDDETRLSVQQDVKLPTNIPWMTGERASKNCSQEPLSVCLDLRVHAMQ